MFAETEGSRKVIGDVEVVWHDGLYHLFHLVLPNHDFIAHAVSTNGLNWRRVRNALFIGDPGSWDDLMLWTLHVSPDPDHEGRWRMFYTGLSRKDQGKIQRIGLAVSDDLYRWRKEPVDWVDQRGSGDPQLVKDAVADSRRRGSDEIHAEYDEGSCFPLAPDPEHYESSLEEGRHWISFRDPFYCSQDGVRRLLAAARVKDGPVIRRGCVASMEEVSPGCFEGRPVLFHPGLYDDIEVPNLVRLDGEWYLIGSLREDAKIRYWHSDSPEGPWRSYADNVLSATGNYACRVSRDGGGWLLWNFYTADVRDRTGNNLMPPPKRLFRRDDGQLRLQTFENFEAMLLEKVPVGCMRALGDGQECGIEGERLVLERRSEFRAFVFPESVSCFRLRTEISLNGVGKCGLVFRVDEKTHDGYYLSLDLFKGVAQLRAWDTNCDGHGEQMMDFRSLQSGYWLAQREGSVSLQLLVFGSYIELSVDGRVLLSLADQTFSDGCVGAYVDTGRLTLTNTEMRKLKSPAQSDDHLTQG